MKRFKTLLLIILVVALMLETAPGFVTAYADEEGAQDNNAVSATLSTNEIPVAGQQFYVHMILNSAGIYGASGSVEYSDNLVLVAVNCADSNWQVETYGKNFAVYGTTPTSKDVEAISFLFQVSATAKENDSVSVSIQNLTISNGAQDLSIEPLLWENTTEIAQEPVIDAQALLSTEDSACVGSMFYLYLAVKGDAVNTLSGTLAYDETKLTLVDAEPVLEGWVAELDGKNFTVEDEWTPTPGEKFDSENGTQLVAFRFRVNNSVSANADLQVQAANLSVADGFNTQAIESVTWNTTADFKDTEAPVVTSVELDKATAEVGNVINVTAAVEDKSVVDEVELWFHCSETGYSNSLYCYLTLNQEDQKYHGMITIDENDYNGTYRLNQIYTRDSAGNTKYYYRDNSSNSFYYGLQNVQFAVTGNPYAPAQNDTTAPVVTGVSFDKANYTAGETVTITVNATDDTDINYGYVYLANDKATNTRSVYVNKSADGVLTGTMTLNQYMASGSWYVSYGYIYDTSGNSAYIAKNLSAGFSMTNANEDVTAPVIESIEVEKTSYRVTDSINISVSAADAGAGLHHGYVYFKNAATGKSYGVGYVQDYDEDGVIDFTLNLGQYAPAGVYTVNQVTLYDNAGNYVYYYADTENINQDTHAQLLPVELRYTSFTVRKNANEDITAPVMESVTFDKEIYSGGETVQITAKVTDDVSGVSNVEIGLKNSQTTVTKGISLFLDTDGLYKGTWKLDDYARTGEYFISRMYGDDNAGNYADYRQEDFPDAVRTASFIVDNPNEDVTAPVLKGLTVDMTGYQPGDVIEVTFDCTEEQSGFEHGTVYFENEKRKSLNNSWGFNNSEKKCYLYTNEYVASGTYVVSEVQLRDKNGNYSYYYRNDATRPLPDSVKDITIVIDNPNEDITPPTVNGLTFDKAVYMGGQTVEMQLDCTDDLSGFDYGNIYFQRDGDNKQYNVNFDRNSMNVSGKYTASLQLSEYISSGNYYVYRISLYDNANNRFYGYRGNSYQPLPSALQKVYFKVDNPNQDITAPELNSVALDKTTYSATETAQLTVNCVDDNSGISSAEILFYNADKNKDIYAHINTTGKNALTGSMSFDTWQAAGNYVIQWVYLYDKCGNGCYYSDSMGNKPLPSAVKSLSFTLNNENEDVTPPEIQSVEFDTSKLDTNGTVTVKVSLTDDNSGVSWAGFYLESGSSGHGWYSLEKHNDGFYYATLDAKNEKAFPVGVYHISNLNCCDMAGNNITYSRYDSNFSECLKTASFTIKGDYDLVLSGDENDIVQQIQATSDTAKIYIESNGSYNLSKDVLDAIKGTHRSLELRFWEATLQINGQDITGTTEDVTIYAGWNGIYSNSYATVIGNCTLFPLAGLSAGTFNGAKTGFPLTCTVDLKGYNEKYQNMSGLYLYKVTFDETAGVQSAELVQSNVAIKDGVLTLKFDQLSGYSNEYYLTTEKALTEADLRNDTGTCGENLTFTFHAADRSLTISGTGEMENYGYRVTKTGELIENYAAYVNAPWIKYANFIQTVTVENGVTSIGDEAFSNLRNVTAVNLPDSLRTIGRSAFEGCGVAEISIPSKVVSIGDFAFRACSISQVSIAGTVTQLGYGVFWGCSNLKSVTLPSNLKIIDDRAFSYCESLSSISIPGTVTTIGYSSFGGCLSLREVDIPYGVERIEGYAYANCTRLKKVTIPASVEYIAPTAFYGCSIDEYIVDGDNPNYKRVDGVLYDADMTVVLGCDSSVTSVTLPRTVTEISYGAFKNCTKLKSISIPAGVQTIRQSAFAGCTELSSVTLPAGLTKIDYLAFQNCSGLTTISIPAATTSIELSAFNGCENLETIQVATGNSMYSGKDGILYSKDGSALILCPQGKKSVTVPNGTREIAGVAFENCAKLKSVKLPDGLNGIGSDAFNGCVKLTEITIPASVKAIECFAFCNCRNLISMTFLGNMPQIDEYVFAACNVTCYYPCSNTTWANVKNMSMTQEEAENQGFANGMSVIWEKNHQWDAGQVTKEATKTEDGNTKYNCAVCHSVGNVPIPALGFDTEVEDMKDEGVKAGDIVYVDGIATEVNEDGSINIQGTDATSIVAFTTNDPTEEDVHKQYPTEIKVWLTTYDETTGSYKAVRMEEFDDCLQYSGSSIRVTGKKGIRMITSVPSDLKSRLTKNGLEGYTLYEYGTLVAWDHELRGEPLVFGSDVVKSAYAYRKGVADPVFKSVNGLCQYTNVLVGFSLEQCKPDLAMRPYIILKDAQGNDYTIYGGEVHRSIAYIAYQNRDAFKAGTEAYDYLWEIIHYAYGDKYDSEYKG